MAQFRVPPCGDSCRWLRLQLTPPYQTCKQERLCDLVDPGLLAWSVDANSLDEYRACQQRLLAGMHALEQRQQSPLPTAEDEFVRELLDAHGVLFREAVPQFAGRFRGKHDHVKYGGAGRHGRDGWADADIDRGVRLAFRVAASKLPALRRAATFLELFFRVHPFSDGNGRLGRFYVQKIVRTERLAIRRWNTSGQWRRRYISALEYAHRFHEKPDVGLVYLERWLRSHIVATEDDEEEGGANLGVVGHGSEEGGWQEGAPDPSMDN